MSESTTQNWRTIVLAIVLIFSAGVAAQAATVYGVNTANQLVRFNSTNPGVVTTVGAISGLQTGENVLGIDFRPATGQLYALGSSSRLYTINLSTAAATAVGSAGAFALNGTDFGFDFNPTVDRIRVISNAGQNLRLNPNDGALAATDGTINPAGLTPTAAAYTNSFAGATSTTLYDIDTTTNSLYIQNPPNNGTLVLVGPLGVIATGVNGFDIAASDGRAYAALTVGGVSRLYAINLSTGAATLVASMGGGNILRGLAVQSGTAASARGALDFDSDNRADYTVFRLSSGTQFVNRSSNNSFYAFDFGIATDIQVPGDYDGDGRADPAVWRSSNGVFYVFRSSTQTVQVYQFGIEGDEPVARDYDGDGRTDFAVVRRAGGQMTWYINNSATNTFRIEPFGLESDIVAPGDYDGDDRFDLAVYRNQNGQGVFYVQRSAAGLAVVEWGIEGDLVAPGDYDGDGKTDFTVVRQGSNYTWYILRSSDNTFAAPQLGAKPDYTVQADYDGDGRTDIAVWRPQTGTFFVLRSSNNLLTQTNFGQNGDYPIANYETH